MSFVRAKQIPPRTGNWYDYEVETYHENGHVRQRVLRYLGLSGRNAGKSSGGAVSSPRPTASIDTKVNTNKPTYIPTPAPAIHPVACKHCQSENVKKYGTYKGVQNYFCNDCHTKFTGTDALPHGKDRIGNGNKEDS